MKQRGQRSMGFYSVAISRLKHSSIGSSSENITSHSTRNLNPVVKSRRYRTSMSLCRALQICSEETVPVVQRHGCPASAGERDAREKENLK